MVSDALGNVRVFPDHSDGQVASNAILGQNYAGNNSDGIASLNGRFYMAQRGLGRVVEVNPDGTMNQVIVSGLAAATGILADPHAGRLFVSTPQGGQGIFVVDPIAKTATLFKAATNADGLSLSSDGLTLYAAIFGIRILGFNTGTGAQVFDSGSISGVDGTAVGAGSLAGKIFANSNGGTVWEIDLATSSQTLIASGGSRGDFVAVDPTDCSLLLTQTDRIVRLHAPCGGCFASSKLQVSPLSGSNPVGTTHTVDAATAVNDLPIGGVTVQFSVVGANSASGACITGADGVCSFTYRGFVAGEDTITATAAINCQDLTAVASATWVPCTPGPNGCCEDSDCSDNNPCTDDSCDNPGTAQAACRHTNNSAGCDDSNQCTTGDVCSGGRCMGVGTLNCDDGNVCTDDICDPTGGCRHANNSGPCDDGNACTRTDACVQGSCVGSDPVICSAVDQCHDAGSCIPANGACTNPLKPDGSVCDDHNRCTSGEFCQAGTCTDGTQVNCDDSNSCTEDSCDATQGCLHQPNGLCQATPRTQGFWKRLCKGPHPEGLITAEDVQCVAHACTFSTVRTLSDLCRRLNPDPPNDKCQQAEAQFMALMLNHCQARVSDAAAIVSECTTNTTVGQSRLESDGLLCDPARGRGTCTAAQCESEEINSGKALGLHTLSLERMPDGRILLEWENLADTSGPSGPRLFSVLRRESLGVKFTEIGRTADPMFIDATAPVEQFYEYSVEPIW